MVGGRISYFLFTEPIIISRPRGMALVRKALSKALLTGIPSGLFEGSITVKLLKPTEIWTPFNSGSSWIKAKAPSSRLRLPPDQCQRGRSPGQ